MKFLILGLVAIVLISGCTSTGYVVKAKNDNMLGPENAKVTIIEYSDFECPFCSRAKPTIDQILEKYPDDVKVIFKHMPLTQLHPYAQKAAEAAECAADQGKFWEMHDMLFDNQDNLYTTSLKEYAKDLGLDTEQFNACLDSGAMKARIDKDAQEAQSAGVRGTPAFFVNGRLISGAQPFTVFDSAVKAALAA
jgi:protein-disulfide isomerase